MSEKVNGYKIEPDANLRGANLCEANLCEANLRGANLRGANLRGANLDYSVFPLWCGSVGIKADDRLVYQLLYHICALNVDHCTPDLIEEVKRLKPLAERFRDYQQSAPRLED